jgi:hypothetical protein
MVIDGKINYLPLIRALFQCRGQVDTEKPAGLEKSNVGFLSWSIKSSSDSKYFAFSLIALQYTSLKGK